MQTLIQHRFKVALFGRPNVGKSSLFNRLIKKNKSLVYDTPGVTRDYIEEDTEINDYAITLYDTAGFELKPSDAFAELTNKLTLSLLKSIHMVLFVLDQQFGVHPDDAEYMRFLQKQKIPFYVVLNKADVAAPGSEFDFAQLGITEFISVSALHAEGLYDLEKTIANAIPTDHQYLYSVMDPDDERADSHDPVNDTRSSKQVAQDTIKKKRAQDRAKLANEKETIRVTVVGRPNVGKSTFINKFIGENRLMTGDLSGMTRDSVDIHHALDHETDLVLFDTAGLKTKQVNKITDDDLLKLSLKETYKTIQFSELVIMLIDASEPISQLDRQIAQHIADEGRACLFILNKIDLVGDNRGIIEDHMYFLEKCFHQIQTPLVIEASAIRGRGLKTLGSIIKKLYQSWNQRIGSARINRFLQDFYHYKSPPIVKGRMLKLKYMTQIKSRPPHFHVWCNIDKKDIPKHYLRHLLRQLGQIFHLEHVPLRLSVRKSDNPYAGRSKKGKK